MGRCGYSLHRPFHFINHHHNTEKGNTIMAATLGQEDYDGIAAAIKAKTQPVGGTVEGATITEDFETQTHTQTLGDGTTRVDHQFVEDPE
jgi:hypothetical protein